MKQFLFGVVCEAIGQFVLLPWLPADPKARMADGARGYAASMGRFGGEPVWLIETDERFNLGSGQTVLFFGYPDNSEACLRLADLNNTGFSGLSSSCEVVN